MVLYEKGRDYGGCSCMASLFLFTFFIMIIISYFSEDQEFLRIGLWGTAILLFILLAINLLAYKAEHGVKTMLLTVSAEGIHYYEHTTFIQWSAVTDIQIINHELSVSVGKSPSLDFKLNLLDTDLRETFDDFCQLLNRYYYPKSIYIYETAVSCGC